MEVRSRRAAVFRRCACGGSIEPRTVARSVRDAGRRAVARLRTAQPLRSDELLFFGFERRRRARSHRAARSAAGGEGGCGTHGRSV